LKAVKAKCKFEKKQTKKTVVCFSISPLLYRKFLWMSTIHKDIFLRQALWADSSSPQINTIASHDKFNPIRIEENLGS